MALYVEDSPLLYIDSELGKHCAELRQNRTSWSAVLAWLRRYEDYARELYDQLTVMVLGLDRDRLVDDPGGAFRTLEEALAVLGDVRSALNAQSITRLEEALTKLKRALQTLRHLVRSDDEPDEGGSGVPAHPKPPTRPFGEARARPTFIDDPAE